MNRPAIVAIGYDRPQALQRLLSSIESAIYAEDIHPVLVISIDNSGRDDVIEVARRFEYTHGEKVIMARPERMGLRAHVLSCGDLTQQYGSIIVLEDDIFVSPQFYSYACAALDHAQKDDRIGAVSLYDHKFNVHRRESFCAIDDGYDNYYLQLASSWGQAYTKKQWDDFKAWYEKNKDRDLAGPFVPANVSGWSERSWLKYYIVYMIEMGKFAIYPRISLTTNFGDVGTHTKRSDTDLQVPVAGKGRNSFKFSSLDDSRSVYDSFFEPLGIMDGEKIRLGAYINDADRKKAITVDLYGVKPVEEIIRKTGNRYALSSSALPFKAVKSFGRQMRPVDANIVFDISGDDIRLYDTSKSCTPPRTQSEAHRLMYEYKGISVMRMFGIICHRVKERFGRD